MDNEYLSPYAVTVVYNNDSLLESAIAMACSRAQLVSWDNDQLPSINHPTPDLIIIDPLIADVFTDSLVSFLMSMTNRVHILTDVAGKYDRLVDKYPAILDEFTFENIYQYVKPSSSAVLYAFEQVIASYKSSFTPSFKDITPESGKYFRLMLTSNDQLGEIYDSGFRCFQTVESMVAAGKVLHENHEKEIETIINGRQYVKSLNTSHYVIMADEAMHQDIVERVKVMKNELTIVLSPRMDSNGIIWRVTAVGDIAYEFLKKHNISLDITGDESLASTFISCERINELILS